MTEMNYSYYESISGALEGIRNNTVPPEEPEQPAVEVIQAAQELPVIRLLKNVETAEVINISENVVLDLNGKRLNFVAAGCLNFAAGTDCVIVGTYASSTVYKQVYASTENPYLVKADGSLKLEGGRYVIEGSRESAYLAVKATTTCGLLELEGCRVYATNNAENTTAGVKSVQTQAEKTVVRDSKITATAKYYAHGLYGMGEMSVENSEIIVNAGTGNARGIHNAAGNLTVANSNVNATSSSFEAFSVRSDGGTVNVVRSRINANSVSGAACGMYCINGANYEMDKTVVMARTGTGMAKGIHISNGVVSVTNGQIRAVNAGEAIGDFAYGIDIGASGVLKAFRTNISADARGDDAETGPYSIAINNQGTATLEYVNVMGNHSGVQNCAGGKLYVSGGQCSGYCHGGVYLMHGVNGEAFLNNVYLHGGFYYGEFAYKGDQSFDEVNWEDYYPTAGRNFAAMYVGTESGSTAYLDGCTIDGSDAQSAIVLRGSNQEQNNTLNLSNTTFTDSSKKIRIDNNSLRLNVGVGCNITTDSFANTNQDETVADYVQAGRAAFTAENYRRFTANPVYNGWDYDYLVAQAGLVH